VRRITAHSPDQLPIWEYHRQIFWGTGVDLPEDDLDAVMQQITLDRPSNCPPPATRRSCRCRFPPEFIIVLEAGDACRAVHRGEGRNRPRSGRPYRSPITNVHAPTSTVELRPGPLRPCRWTIGPTGACPPPLPGVWVANDAHECRCRQAAGPISPPKRLLSNQTFRDIYRTDTLDVDQRLKIHQPSPSCSPTSKGSTELYERVGRPGRLRPGARAFPRRCTRSWRPRAAAVVKTIGRRGDGDLPHARPRASPAGAAHARGDAAA